MSKASKQIKKKTLKIGLLADDITILLTDLNSVKRSMEILKCYAKCAGLIINVEKNTGKVHSVCDQQ